MLAVERINSTSIERRRVKQSCNPLISCTNVYHMPVLTCSLAEKTLVMILEIERTILRAWSQVTDERWKGVATFKKL